MTYWNRTGDAWKHRNDPAGDYKTRKYDKQARQLTTEPQFTVDDLWLSPFTKRINYETSEDGFQLKSSWVDNPEREKPLTGIRVFDEWLRYLAGGGSCGIGSFAERYGLAARDIDSLALVMTGMKASDLRLSYQLRTMEALMRHTDLELEEIGRRSGIGSLSNMYFTTKREFGETPLEHRRRIRRKGDLGKYKL